MLGGLGLWLAGGLLVAGALAGAAYGFLLKLPAADVARLADRGYGLADRISTALEWANRSDRTPMIEALVADAEAHAQRLDARRIIARRFPREAKLVPLPLAAGLLLSISPPIPLPQGSLPNFSVSREDDEDKPKDRAGEIETSERAKPVKRDPVQRAEVMEKNLVPRMGSGGPTQPGDLSAIFKDTSLGAKTPDFNSFLKKGDERIRMLEQLDRLPDLQQDYTQRQSKVVFQKAKSLKGGLDPSKVSPEKLRELLNEMERLGRKGGPNNWSGDVSEGMEALEGGQTDKAMEAMERALSKLRSMDEKGRDGKGLRGGRENDRKGGQRGRERGSRPAGRTGRGRRFPRGRRAPAGAGEEREPEGRRDRPVARQSVRRRRGGRVAPGAQAGSRHQHDRTRRQHAVPPAVPRRARAVPEDDGRVHRARTGARETFRPRSRSTSKRWTRSSAVATVRAGHELLSAEFLTQLERFALISRRAFRGRVRGERKSPRKGSSVEFSDYRAYGLGDDIRYVDWNIYGRLDRLYLKLFLDEEDLCLHLLIDASKSMEFGDAVEAPVRRAPRRGARVRRARQPGAGGRRRRARARGRGMEPGARAQPGAPPHGLPRSPSRRPGRRRSATGSASTPGGRGSPGWPS